MNAFAADLFRYNAWANRRTLEACAALGPARLEGRVLGMEWTLARTLMHLVGGQDSFLYRLSDLDPARRAAFEPWSFEGGAWPGFDVLRAAEARTSADLIAVAEAVEADSYSRLPRWEARDFRAKRSFLLLHAFEHGVEHRTQINITLSEWRIEPPDLDGWAFAFETPGLVVEG
jgi:uncharacterized damage-inducible protein DinB